MTNFSITSAFKKLVRFSIFYGVSYEMQVCLAMFTHGFSLFFLCSWIPLRSISPNKFFQKKKRKKRKPSFQVEGFKKASFSDKILPDKVEILSETRRAWTCFFVNLELIFASFFLFIFFEFQINCCFEIGCDFGIVLSNVIVFWNVEVV
jgi:hypothetical protein